MKIRTLIWILACPVLLAAFQNCGKANFSSAQADQSSLGSAANDIDADAGSGSSTTGANPNPSPGPSTPNTSAPGPTTPPPPTAAACFYQGNWIPHLGTIQTFPAQSLPYGQTCMRTTRTCRNGSFDGSAHATCNVDVPGTKFSGAQVRVFGNIRHGTPYNAGQGDYYVHVSQSANVWCRARGFNYSVQQTTATAYMNREQLCNMYTGLDTACYYPSVRDEPTWDGASYNTARVYTYYSSITCN